MDEKITYIIGQIKQQILTDRRVQVGTFPYFPPVTFAEINDAEQRLGFILPELLRRIYTEVANGGFGPFNRILGLKNGWFTTKGESANLVELYKDCLETLPFPPFPYFRWPEKLLPICEDSWDLICLDCNKAEMPVIKIHSKIPDSQGLNWEIKISFEAISFQNWLENWLSNL